MLLGRLADVDKTSQCCGKKSLDFYWRSCVDGQHVAAAVTASLAALQANGGRLNPIQEADAASRVKRRINRARQGKLRSPAHVKTIRSAPELVDMFELRWGHEDDRDDDLIVSRYDALGHLLTPAHRALLRLYYVEQPDSGAWFLGLHVHEKTLVMAGERGRSGVDQEATDEQQQLHIDRAIAILDAGAHDHCGVPELSQRFGNTPLAS